MRSGPILIVVLLAGSWFAAPQTPVLQAPPPPPAVTELKFAVIGDNGDGSSGEYDVARRMTEAHSTFPFELVIMVGDNMYGSQRPQDFVTKFERPFATLLQIGVPFFAAKGNHDGQVTLTYRGFNMSGERYYTFVRQGVRFLVLDTNEMDPAQLAWAKRTLATSQEEWKIAYFHHPFYSNGDRHGSNVDLRVALEPTFVSNGVSVVFAGHDHVYERLTPQKGIAHFVAGSGGRLRKGGLTPSETTAAYFDQDQAFMLVEIVGEEMRFRAISRTGQTVDSGVIRRRSATQGDL